MSDSGFHPRPTTLLRYALGELDSDARLAVESHVVDCASCAGRLEGERGVDEAFLATEPAPPAPGQARAAYQRLWADVDQQPNPPISPPLPPQSWLRPRVRWAAAAVLILTAGVSAWVLLSRGDSSASAPPSRLADAGAVEDGALIPEAPVGPMSNPEPAEVPGPGRLVRSEPASEPLDVGLLAVARGRVAEVLVEADDLFPVDDERFRLMCETAFAPLRAEGWSLTHLLRGQVLGGSGEASDAAVRFAVLDPGSAPTLARCLDRLLDRPDRSAAVLDRMTLHDFDLTGSPTLARALGRLASSRPGALPDREILTALQLLDRPGGEAALTAALERSVTRALRASPESSAIERTYAVLAVCAAPAQVEALAKLATVPAHEGRARQRFELLVEHDRQALGRAAAERLTAARPGDVPLSRWCVSSGLTEVAGPLVTRLESDPRDPELLDLVQATAGADEVGLLFTIWREHMLRPEADDIGFAIAVVLAREPDAQTRLGAEMGPAELEDLVSLAEHLPVRVRGTVLLAALGHLDPITDRAGWRAYLLTRLARLGDATTGKDLLAWIDRAGSASNRSVLALAWATAQHLTGDDARLAWAAAGRDPVVLQRASDARGAWPSDADRLPRRALRGVHRSLSALEGNETL